MKTEEFDFYNSTSIKSYNLNESIRYQLKTLDGLDAYTRKHSENVANVSCRLCEKLGLPRGFTIYTTTCAYLHDIGKIFIPPSILQKPEKLTDEEYEIMKTHTTIGYKMAMNDLKLRPYAAGPLYHHEALDGTGYPNGIKGNKIPYEAQIIRVADEFDAITSKRQYKSHVGVVDTLKMLIEHARPSTENGVLKTISNGAVGKIDKNILKALFKVVIDDTEYEIASRSTYLKYIKEEIKRLEQAKKYYYKVEGAATEAKKAFFREEASYYLAPNEKPELIPQIIEEFHETYKVRQEHLYKLNYEVKEIKRLTI